MCDNFTADNVFLVIMTAVSCLIVYVDLQVMEKMFEEYFLLAHYMSKHSYEDCYAPQAQMRMIFESFAIYCAVLVTLLTAALAFNMTDDAIVWMATKIVNVSFLLFGPLMFTLCIYGMFNIKSLSRVCGMHGIIPGEFNYVCVTLVIVMLLISAGISYYLASQKTMDMAHESFNNETSLLYNITQYYFQYQRRLSSQRRRIRRRERDYDQTNHTA
jgi:hypothetical protein